MSIAATSGAAAAPASGAAASIDLNRYGRQVGVFGLEAMGKLITLDVLVLACAASASRWPRTSSSRARAPSRSSTRSPRPSPTAART